MALPFVQHGAEEIVEKQRSALNTSRFISPSKDKPLQIVPLVPFEAIGNESTIISYAIYEIWWDGDAVDALKDTLSEEDGRRLRKKSEFPQLSADPEVDPGTWLMANPEIIENCKVKTSSRYRNSGDTAITKKRVYMVPVLWLNDPDLEGDQPPFEVKMFKFTQSTIFDGFKSYYEASSGRFKHHTFSIVKDAKQPRYNVVALDPYTDYVPALDIEAEEMITMTTRSEQEEHLALYGIGIPPVPENKRHIVEAMEEVEEVDEDDEWDEEEE